MQMIMPYRRHRHRHPSALGYPAGPMMPRRMRAFDGSSVMSTDISQSDEGYELSMELPGFSKDDVQIELKDGYLIVSAEMSSEVSEPSSEEPSAEVPVDEAAAPASEEQSSEERGQTWIRRERFFGSCQRSFYMGEGIDEEGIQARFENGLLKVSVPKLAQEPAAEQKKLIAIEG